MANDSTVAGPLAPIAGGPAPLEGAALNDFLQGFIAGLTGLDGTLVRPRWQAEPPNIPPAATAWAAVGVNVRPGDTFAYIEHDGAYVDPVSGVSGRDIVHQHETLDLLCSFYDLGTDSQADNLASILRQGLQLDQNLELLGLNSFGLVACGDPLPVPTIFKTRWLYRVDMPIELRREITRAYAVRNLAGAGATVIAEPSGGAVFVRTVTATP